MSALPFPGDDHNPQGRHRYDEDKIYTADFHRHMRLSPESPDGERERENRLMVIYRAIERNKDRCIAHQAEGVLMMLEAMDRVNARSLPPLD